MEKLREQYEKEVVPALMKKFNYKSVMQVPKLEKIVINIGLGDTKENPKALENAMNDLTQITGQRPVITKARKSIAAFKLREGANIGCKVTLRSNKMYDFAYKLFNVALPRVRDFRGVSGNSFDGRGNYSMGVKEQLIFPEIEYDKVDKLRGMDIIFVTTANSDEEAKELLKLIKDKEGEKYQMAKKSMKVKQARPQKYSTREYNRCKLCGRPHAYIRKYGICRVCFRELAHKGEIPGVKKASW